VVFEEQAQGVPDGLVSAVVHASFGELVQELHVPLGQPDRYPFSLTLFGHSEHARRDFACVKVICWVDK